MKEIMLNDLKIALVNSVRHLGNYINKSLFDKLDCQHKLSTFIGKFNKLNAKFKNLQHGVIARLFKSSCCYFMALKHGALIHALVYQGTKVFETFIKKFNITLTWILGPLFLVNCNNLSFVFYIFNTE